MVMSSRNTRITLLVPTSMTVLAFLASSPPMNLPRGVALKLLRSPGGFCHRESPAPAPRGDLDSSLRGETEGLVTAAAAGARLLRPAEDEGEGSGDEGPAGDDDDEAAGGDATDSATIACARGSTGRLALRAGGRRPAGPAATRVAVRCSSLGPSGSTLWMVSSTEAPSLVTDSLPSGLGL